MNIIQTFFSSVNLSSTLTVARENISARGIAILIDESLHCQFKSYKYRI